MSQKSFSAKFFLQILKNAKHGQIQVTFPDGKVEHFGEGSLVATVQVNKWSAFEQLVSKGDIGLAEEIIDGNIIVDDIASLIEWACLNDQSLEAAIHGRWIGTILYKIKHLLSKNSKSQARKNIMAHYDLGNDFYKTWLDQTMSYSSAIFKHEDEDLVQAQYNKYDRMIDLLNIKSGDHILEVGCGWGGFFSRVVERTDCKVTAVMNSPQQRLYNQNLIQQRGMSKNIDLKELDYRDISGRYDKIVSIEMIEAVGKQYWDSYFMKLRNSLKSRGEAIIQGITIQDKLFYSYQSKTDFIQNYVFPGGMLLSNSIISEKSKMHDFELSDTFEFGSSYAKTLKLWDKKFVEQIPLIKSMGFDEKFIRLWRLYLGYCEGAFRAQRINVGQYHLSAK